MRVGLIIAPSLADTGSFLFELKYPSNLKCSSDEFFLFCSLPFLLTQGTVTSTLRASFNRLLMRHARVACVTQITQGNSAK